MTQEQIETIAKYATDSYFANMDENQKRPFMISSDNYIKAYTQVYMNAMKTVAKEFEKNVKSEELANQFH